MRCILPTLVLALCAASTVASPEVSISQSFSAAHGADRATKELHAMDRSQKVRSIFYADRAAFEAAAPGLTVESFTGATVAPGAVVGCGNPVLDPSPCFRPGGLAPDVRITSTGGEIVTLGEGLFGNATPAVAADLFGEATIFEFTRPDIYAAGFRARLDSASDSVQIEVYGIDGSLIDMATTTLGAEFTFRGVVATQPIARVTLTALNRRGEIIDEVLFGHAYGPPAAEDFENGVIDPAWTLAGVGNANQASVMVIDDGGNRELALTADGATAYLGKDNAGFLYQEVWGDFRLEADLDTSTMTTGKIWRKAGLMVRASNDDDDIRLLAMHAPLQGRLQFVAREVAGGPGNVKVALEEAAPHAVRLAIERVGQVLTVQYSLDGGATWITPSTGLGGSIDIAALPAKLYVGLATVSNNISVTSTALFDNVLVVQ
ncbi:MAG: hypothetical protein AAGM22_03825 [Acidobacteriota bacterium]